MRIEIMLTAPEGSCSNAVVLELKPNDFISVA